MTRSASVRASRMRFPGTMTKPCRWAPMPTRPQPPPRPAAHQFPYDHRALPRAPGSQGIKRLGPCRLSETGISSENTSVTEPARKGDASAHACPIEQGGHSGCDEPGQMQSAPIPARALAPSRPGSAVGPAARDHSPLPVRPRNGKGRQPSLDPVCHLARRVTLILQLDLHSQVPAVAEFGRTRLQFHGLEYVQDPLAG